MRFFYFLKTDFLSSIVVFFVALPMCLGIALASGAPLSAGLISGIIGGIVVGAISKSPFSVSGPAAGLATIVLAAFVTIGSFEGFLASLVIAGILQIVLGIFKAGKLAQFFPSSVIVGMLSSIGILLMLKQIPHLVGNDLIFFGNESFAQGDGQNTFSEITYSLQHTSVGAIVIGFVSCLILFFWKSRLLAKVPFLQNIPGPIVAVVVAVVLQKMFALHFPSLAISEEHFVQLPSIKNLFVAADFSAIGKLSAWNVAVTIAVVASLQSLLSIEACDKLDPLKRRTPINRELIAQGCGNLLAGLLGGLPITTVIVRSSTNMHAGAKTNASTISQGAILLIIASFFPAIVEEIPLAALAGILIFVGYRLTPISLLREMYRKGLAVFLPFIATIVGVLASDLLRGVFIGLIAAVIVILGKSYKKSIILVKGEHAHLIKFVNNITFLNKSTLFEYLLTVKSGDRVIIDGNYVGFVDSDIIDIIRNFQKSAKEDNIYVEIKNINQFKNET